MGIALLVLIFAGHGGAAPVLLSVSLPHGAVAAPLPVLPFRTAAPAERGLHPGLQCLGRQQCPDLKLEKTACAKWGVHRPEPGAGICPKQNIHRWILRLMQAPVAAGAARRCSSSCCCWLLPDLSETKGGRRTISCSVSLWLRRF